MPSREELIAKWEGMDFAEMYEWFKQNIPGARAMQSREDVHFAELAIAERGLSSAYGHELNRIVGGDKAATSGERHFLIAHASPAQRALAAYIVLESQHVAQ